MRIAVELLGIQPFDATGLDEVAEISPSILSPFAISVKGSVQQHKMYRLIMREALPARVAATYQPELKPLTCLICNPNLKRSTLYLMIRDGLWKEYPSLLWQPLFDVNEFAKASPKVRGNFSPELANTLFEQNFNMSESLILELWSVGIQHKNRSLLLNCASHPKASIDMIDAYLSNKSIQEIELRRQGIDEENIEAIRDFFWY